MTTPTDTAKLADEIEALAKKYQEAWDCIRAIPHDCQIPFDKMMELESAERAITRVCMDKSTTIIAALRELEAMKAREAKLREALEPFAEIADRADQGWTSGNEYGDHTLIKPPIATRHFRRARAALGGAG